MALNFIRIRFCNSPRCRWPDDIKNVLQKYDLPYEPLMPDCHIAANGKTSCSLGCEIRPCIEVNGHILNDISGAELESYLISNHLVPSCGESEPSPSGTSSRPVKVL